MAWCGRKRTVWFVFLLVFLSTNFNLWTVWFMPIQDRSRPARALKHGGAPVARTAAAQSLHQGRVLKEFLQRVLSRRIASSNVLVVAGESTVVAAAGGGIKGGGGGAVVTEAAKSEGHRVFYFNTSTSSGQAASTDLDGKWWSQMSSSKPSSRPGWFLLTFLQPAPPPHSSLTAVLAGMSSLFLQQATATYIVMAVHFEDTSQARDGLEAVRLLHARKYKVQLLASTIYLGDDWLPNSLLTSETASSFFSEGQVRMASLTGSSRGPHSRRAVTAGPGGGEANAYLFATQVVALLSLSVCPQLTNRLQGLDLAIPSRREYLDTSHQCRAKKGAGRPLSGRCGDALHLPVTVPGCPIIHSHATVQWAKPKHQRRQQLHVFCDGVEKQLPDRHGPDYWVSNTTHPAEAEAACVRIRCLGESIPASVACITRILPPPSSLQGTAQLPLPYQQEARQSNRRKKHGREMNIITILIDPISRAHFKRSLPRTAALLKRLGMTSFDQYAAVGANSGPNQAALFSGVPLEQGQRSSISSHNKNNEWIWDRLRQDLNYTTLKAEDGCVENSNMMQSIKPATSHGRQLDELFCFNWDRPNCVGGTKAADHLVEYAKQFITAQSHPQASSVEVKPPWAAFLSFIDSHEDSMALAGVLDAPLSNLLLWLNSSTQVWDNTVVVVLSDHGLHYGPYFQTPQGERERAEPILHMHFPASVLASVPGSSLALKTNSKLWTTPFDVHQTILHAAGIGSKTNAGYGKTLLRHLPLKRQACESTAGIPVQYCPAPADISMRRGCQSMHALPPSLLSFFSDIPRQSRPVWPTCNMTPPLPPPTSQWVSSSQATPLSWWDFSKQLVVGYIMSLLGREGCMCATSSVDWYPCSSHPWHYWSLATKEDYFAVTVCPGGGVRVENRVLREQKIVDRYHKALAAATDDVSQSLSSTVLEKQPTSSKPAAPPLSPPRPLAPPAALPNILFIEIDSVSRAYADRHLPKTRALLAKHRIQKAPSQNASAHCPTGLCAADFELSNVVGAASLVNMLAALSGCVGATHHQGCAGYNATTGGLPTSGCAAEGRFEVRPLGCLSCPPGQTLRNPSQNCITTQDAVDQCCGEDFQGMEVPGCRLTKLPSWGLRLLKRGPLSLSTWCPAGPGHYSNEEAGSSESTVEGNESNSPWIFDIANKLGYVTFFGEEFCADGSPFAVQESVFPTTPDISLQTLFCRLASEKARRQHLDVTSPLWGVELGGTPTHPEPCVDGRSMQQLAFEQITQMFDKYPDVPKLAFLNAISAHDYAIDVSRMALGAEAYDDHLSSFLNKMMSRTDSSNTVIVMRSDHGLQGGPAVVDYSFQMEHRLAWTEMIVPKTYSRLNVDALAGNQQRLITGFDIYHTLRALMKGGRLAGQTKLHEKSGLPPFPTWSYDLINVEVPEARTCASAKVPEDFCSCVNEPGGPKTRFHPNFGVCNFLSPETAKFCEGTEL